MKFKAPDHVSSIELSIGLVEVVDGEIEVADDHPLSDATGLIANGFTPIEQRLVKGKATKPTAVNVPADHG